MQAAGNGGNVAVVGLVSDTHGVLDSATIDALKGRATDAIIHAGDVGDMRKKLRLSAAQIIQRLEESTTNTRIIAVAGNVDEGVSDLPLTQVVTMAGVRILVMHICGFPPKVSQDSQRLINSISPQIVVFGHSHIPGVQWHNNILYVNRRLEVKLVDAGNSFMQVDVGLWWWIKLTLVSKKLKALKTILSWKCRSKKIQASPLHCFSFFARIWYC